jgi:hypothetical protein
MIGDESPGLSDWRLEHLPALNALHSALYAAHLMEVVGRGRPVCGSA